MSISQRLMQSVSPLVMALVLGLFISTFCVLWFMFTAMESERIASIKRIEEMVHRDVLSSLKANEVAWLAVIEGHQGGASSWQFKQLIDQELVVGAIIPSGPNERGYPSRVFHSMALPWSANWKLAQKAEFINKDYLQAKRLYESALNDAESYSQKIVVLQAISRVSAISGEWRSAIEIQREIIHIASQMRKDSAASEIIATALFRILELATENLSGINKSVIDDRFRLMEMLQDYSQYSLSSSHRLLLSVRLNSLFDEEIIPLQLIYAERIADRFLTEQNKESLIIQFEEDRLIKLFHMSSKITIFVPLNKVEERLNRLSADLKGASHTIKLYDKSVNPSSLSQASHIPLKGVYSGLSLEIVNNGADSEAINNTRVALYVLTAGVFIALLMSLYFFIGVQVRKHEKNQKLRTDVLATVSHELKTPLTSTRLLIDNLRESQIDLPKEVRDYIEIISNENYRLSGLVDNFMIFSRMERDKHAFSFEKLQLEQLVQEAALVVASKYPQGYLDVEVESNSLPMAVLGDESLLKTALINLLDNAFKYSSGSQYVKLCCWKNDDGVYISVEDKGIGLSPEQIKLIFDRFYRASYQTDGCGLGLNITQYIITQHGGTISVASQLGEGSIFTIWLPNLS